MYGDKIVTCNVGDCRALVFNKNDEEENFEIVELSVDQCLEREDEKERIVSTSKGQVVTGTSGSLRLIPSASDYDLETVISKKLALGMSRSFGHVVLSNYGAISIPEFTFYTLKDGDILVLFLFLFCFFLFFSFFLSKIFKVAATDGVWGILDNEQVGYIATSNDSNPAVIAKKIVESVKLDCEEEENASDNTTVLVACFTDKKVSSKPKEKSKPKSKPKIAKKEVKKNSPKIPKKVTEKTPPKRNTRSSKSPKFFVIQSDEEEDDEEKSYKGEESSDGDY